ncbi:hypothetical protein K1T35_19530 [Pseudonocardia sp. DSM 110487]|uniref:hypothetical protein n=1 Tax=Pseudonocardia sp. DSM 110487 TaxID=2865833 RepID=UPI001C69668B|nr:hypothetical protein [Pseudonocardia sp. DSM 110487]QYN39193.1 hypothetical protein K1T35_19530 [Pseudonocardia sp. DSM 110487]
MVAAALLIGPGTANAATGASAPVASSLPSEGGTGGDACAGLPVGMQELLCPSQGGADEQASDTSGGSATGGTGSGTAPTGGTTGTAPAAGTSASTPTTPPGVVSNFLIWLAGVFKAAGL